MHWQRCCRKKAKSYIAAHLHDIGKIGVEGVVLRKSGALNEEEWHKMKQHTKIGWMILNKIECFSNIAEIVLHHHEHWDGKGYPSALVREKIPLGARN